MGILGHDLQVEIPTGGVSDPANQRPKIKKMPWVLDLVRKRWWLKHPLTFWRLESGEATCAYSLSVKKNLKIELVNSVNGFGGLNFHLAASTLHAAVMEPSWRCGWASQNDRQVGSGSEVLNNNKPTLF